MNEAYLRIPNWEKHQHRDHASKRNRPWFKLDTGIFDDPAIAELTPAAFRAYIRALTLAARTGNQLPANTNWLRAHLGTNWRKLCQQLEAHNLLTGTIPTSSHCPTRAKVTHHSGNHSHKHDAEQTQKPPQTSTTKRGNTTPTPRLEERRVDKKEQEPLRDARARNHTDNEQAAGNRKESDHASTTRNDGVLDVQQPTSTDEQAATTERVDVPGWTSVEPPGLGDRPAVVASSIGAASSVRSSLLSEFIETKEGMHDPSC